MDKGFLKSHSVFDEMIMSRPSPPRTVLKQTILGDLRDPEFAEQMGRATRLFERLVGLVDNNVAKYSI